MVNVACGSELVTLKVWDTPGIDSVLHIKSRVNEVNVFLLCFAVDKDATYYNVKNKWYSTKLSESSHRFGRNSVRIER